MASATRATCPSLISGKKGSASERFGHRPGEFPVCEDVAARSLALPFFPEMSEGQLARVAEAMRAALGR